MRNYFAGRCKIASSVERLAGFASKAAQERFGAEQSVDRGGEDAAGVACTLAAGIEPAQRGLERLVAQDADRGGAARLGRGEHGVGGIKAVELFAEFRDGAFQHVRDLRRKHQAKRAE